jgi:sodium-dependent dicarboxylate transporter 2/3/5
MSLGPRRAVGLFLGPLSMLAVLALQLLPATAGELDPRAHRLAAIFALVLVWWVTEAIPLAATALLGPALAVTFGVASARDAFAPFGHPVIFLFLGSFVIARAMREHGLDRRIALFALSRPWVGEHPGRIVLAFGAIAAFLSMWMSNTATTAMMLPIGLGVLSTLPAPPRGGGESWPYATGLMLMIAYACNIGGIATPVGSPPNLIAVGMLERLAGRTVTFFDWMRFGLPVSAVLFALLYLVIRRGFPVGVARFEGASDVIRAERRTLGPWSAGERAALGAFLLAVTLWTLPGFVGLAVGREHAAAEALRRLLPEGPAAILAATLLFVVPIDRAAGRFALGWKEAARIDWGTILLFGGGLSLGSMAFETGLAEALGRGLLDATGGLPLVLIALIALFLANVMTEFMSNTATANLLIPMFIALGAEAAGAPMLATVAATVGCSLAFCFPIATPPNAIVYGSGRVPLPTMIRTGVLLDVGCGLLAWAGLVWLAPR